MCLFQTKKSKKYLMELIIDNKRYFNKNKLRKNEKSS